MALFLGGRGVERERLRIDGEAQRRLLQRMLGAVHVALLQQRAAVEGERLAGRRRARRDALERLARLAQERAIVARPFEPDLAERAVDLRLVRAAFECAAQGQHREIPVAGARVREADRHLPRHMIAIEPGDDLQLLELFGVTAERAVEIGQLFAGRNQARRERQRLLERLQRIGQPLLLAQADAEQILGVRQLLVEPDGLLQRRDRAVHVAVAIARERELVADARGAVVEPDAAFVRGHRARVLLQLEEDVAERFERAGCGGIEAGRGAEVARRRFQIAAVAAPLVGLAAAQVGEHRVRPEGDRAAVGFDRVEGLLVAQGGVAAGQQRAVIALRRGLVSGRASGDGQRQHGDGEDRALHGVYPTSREELSGGAGV